MFNIEVLACGVMAGLEADRNTPGPTVWEELAAA